MNQKEEEQYKIYFYRSLQSVNAGVLARGQTQAAFDRYDNCQYNLYILFRFSFTQTKTDISAIYGLKNSFF